MTDLNVLDKERSIELAGGSTTLAEELMGILLEELPVYMAELTNSHQQQDIMAMRQTTHKLNGATTYFGLPALRAAINELETILKSGGHFNGVDSAYQRVVDEVARFQAEIEAG